MVMTTTSAKQLKRVRTLGRGASGAVVWLGSDEASGELVAVKSACAAGAAAQLQREGRVLQGLSSPHIVPCLGSRAAAGGEYQLFLEFAPGGSLADEAARSRSRSGSEGRLAEREIRGYAGDVARGLAYLHGLSLVHGDVKARNVVIGGDGRARLTDFGCARRPAECARPIGGTPAFMAPEVARGQEQGPAADVWALGCMVVEIATGRAPWSDIGHDLLAAVHRIGYTDDVPEVPAWMSTEAKDFLAGCFERRASARSTAAELVAHPFVAAAAAGDRDVDDAVPAKQERFFPSSSPKSTLRDAFWDSDYTDDEADDEMSTGAAERIGALACAASALPDWDSEEGWIDLQDDRSETVDDATPPAAVVAADYFVWADAAELEQFVADAVDASVHLRLPHHIAAGVVAGGASASATAIRLRLRQGSYLPMRLGVREKEIPRPFDRHDDGIQKVESHRACNRNRVVMKRILLKNFPLEITWVGTARTDHVLMPKPNVRSPDSWKERNRFR